MTYATKLFLLVTAITCIFAKCEGTDSPEHEAIYPRNGGVSFSQQFLYAVKSNEPFTPYLDTLSRIDLDSLELELDTREEKLTFWINTYNSLVQTKAKSDSSAFEHRDRFFKKQNLNIGGENLSLDNIEHDILRAQRSQNLNEFLGTFSLEKLDHRIHFALNCGAAACPPIAFYSSEKIDEQLDLAESVFVENTSKFDPEKGELEVSKILDWYKNDFGGEAGIIELVKKHHIVEEQEVKKIIYTPYDWTLDLNNY